MKPGWLIAVLVPFVAWGILKDIANTANGGSIDLRNRVTGARIASANIDPYSYKWTKGQPEQFCDLFNQPGALLSKTTVTPWVLAAHTPFNDLNYRTTQWIWFLIQYAALILMAVIWLRSQVGSAGKWGLLILLMFSVSPAWRHHVDHGQIYVVYASLLLIFFWLSGKTSSKLILISQGITGALLAGSRPVFFSQFAVPLTKHRWLALISAAIFMVLIFLIPVLQFRNEVWEHYLIAMEAHGEIYLNQMKPTRELLAYPPTIEGIPLDTLARFSRNIPFADTSIFQVISFQLPHRFLLICWAVLMVAGLSLMMWKRIGGQILLWSVACWLFAGDFVLPAFRHTYNDALAIPMILIGMAALTDPRSRISGWPHRASPWS